MKKVFLLTVFLVASVAMLATSAVAVPINGEIGFSGEFIAVDAGNNQVSDFTQATGLEFVNPISVGTATNDLAVLSGGTATFQGFDFSPSLNPSPVYDLWTSSDFSFDLEIVDVDFQTSTLLALSGYGTLSGPTGYEPTYGTWNFTGNTLGGVFTFSSGTSVPDASLMYLLGPALLGLGIIGRRRKIA